MEFSGTQVKFITNDSEIFYDNLFDMIEIDKNQSNDKLTVSVSYCDKYISVNIIDCFLKYFHIFIMDMKKNYCSKKSNKKDSIFIYKDSITCEKYFDYDGQYVTVEERSYKGNNYDDYVGSCKFYNPPFKTHIYSLDDFINYITDEIKKISEMEDD